MTKKISESDKYEDWRWQERNSLRQAKDIKRFFPNFPEREIKQVAEYEKTRRWSITPYTLSLMGLDAAGNPAPDHPIVKQTFPIRGFVPDNASDSYDGTQVNWELADEMPTPVLQHKYPNKVILRTPNSCLGYCGYCFEVGRTEDKNSGVKSVNDALWNKSIEYIAEHPEISEVILSGGDPLVMSNEALEKKLADIRTILHVRAIRINTRALTFNPFRIDKGLVKVLKKHYVDALGFHLSNPEELPIGGWASDAIDRLNNGGCGAIKLANIPLIKGVNDDASTLEELFMGAYTLGIKPYYLYHGLPWSPASNQYRTSVRKGVLLMNTLKRHISNVAIPEYAIVHHKGKQTVPLEENGTPEFQYAQDEAGQPIVRFKNWKGNWETYLDGRD